jgi:folate-dependent phosphoribosylglycinamide formyltransferase PurN
VTVVLLTRSSEFQIYCANRLWSSRQLRAAIVEEGFSFTRGTGPGASLRAAVKNARLLAPVMLRRPRSMVDYARLFLRKDEYFGLQDRHHARVLRAGYERFNDDVPVIRVADVNSEETARSLRHLAPDIVLVFGTALIRPELYEQFTAPFVNLHWGWSPDYRGDGIVPALALEGPQALGLTVHLLSSRIDGGDILYRARPVIDAEDNFYSIGLKLTLLGVDLFSRVLEDFARSGRLVGEPQDRSNGRVYGSRYMKTHPGLYHAAWAKLRQAAPRSLEHSASV